MDKYYLEFAKLRKLLEEGISVKEIKEVNSLLSKYKKLNSKNETKLVVLAQKDEIFSPKFFTDFSKIIELLKEKNEIKVDISLSICDDYKKNNFSEKEWKAIKLIEKHVQTKYNIDLGFEDLGNTFSLSQVETANAKIDSLAQRIKSKNLSPLESLLSAYLSVTSRNYIDEPDGENYAMSRSIYGTSNSENMVCVGYSRWLISIMNKLGLENFKIYENSVFCTEDEKTNIGGHSNLIVYIKDEKYNVDGYYYLDPTWDRYFDTKKSSGVSFFMLPLGDIKDVINPLIKSEKFFPEDYQKTYKVDAINISASGDVAYNYYVNDFDLSFGADRFLYNDKFLTDLFEKIPSLPKKILDQIYDEELQTLNKNLEFEKNKLNVLDEVMLMLDKVRFLNAQDFAKLIDVKSRFYKIGDGEEISNLARELAEKYSNFDQKIDFTIKKFLFRIKQDTIYEHKKNTEGDFKSDIKKFETNLEGKLQEIKKIFTWNPNFGFEITFDENKYRKLVSLSKLLGLDCLVQNIENVLKDGSRKPYDFKFVFSEYKSIKNSIKTYEENIRCLNASNRHYLGKLAIEKIYTYMRENALVDQVILENSKPLEFDKFVDLLSTVIDAGIEDYRNISLNPKEVLELAISNANGNYKTNASNSFMQIASKAKDIAFETKKIEEEGRV